MIKKLIPIIMEYHIPQILILSVFTSMIMITVILHVTCEYVPNLDVDRIDADLKIEHLIDFLRADKTDEHTYISGIFDCKDFSKTLIENASVFGIDGIYTVIKYPHMENRHAIVSFYTDIGVVYIEPQTDKFIHPSKFKFAG